jgi:hypothetical protein
MFRHKVGECDTQEAKWLLLALELCEQDEKMLHDDMGILDGCGNGGTAGDELNVTPFQRWRSVRG